MRPFLFALVIALVAGALGAYGFRRTRFARAVPVELANAALEREVQVARALGFEEGSSPETRPLIGSDYGSSNVRLDALELDAGECVAVVAAAHGWGRLSWFRLSRSCPTSWVYRDPNDLSVQQNVRGVVAHVQFCAWEPTHVELCASGFRMRDEPEHSQRPSTITYRVLRASEETIGGAARLDRGTVTRPAPVLPSELPEPLALEPAGDSAWPTTEPAAGAPPSTGREPNRAEVLAVMREVASRVQQCRPSEPARATARVEFASDGTVVSVSVDGVDLETAACIELEARSARLQPFESSNGRFVVSFPFVFQ